MSAKMDEQALLALLRELAIDSQRVEHPAIASIEEYYAQGIELPDQGIKNLFLRNRKGTRHYLVLLDERKEADLPGIAEQIGESRLSFASVERLREYLGVELCCGSLTSAKGVTQPSSTPRYSRRRSTEANDRRLSPICSAMPGRSASLRSSSSTR